MNSIICGQDREALRWALTYALESPDFAARAANSARTFNDGAGNTLALVEIHDPAKLAALIVEEAQRCGAEAADLEPKDGFCCIAYLDDNADVCRSMLNMHQARKILAKLLQLPDGAREDAERVLRGEP